MNLLSLLIDDDLLAFRTFSNHQDIREESFTSSGILFPPNQQFLVTGRAQEQGAKAKESYDRS